MREIKFRAWEKDLKVMVYNNELCGHIGYNCNPVRALNIILNEDDYGYEFMQYTGLKDKNGREIYEGDVLLFNNTHPNAYLENWLCVVKYRCGSFVCEYPKDGVYNHFDSWNDFVKWEVIGNRFEIPELLEGAE
ncbi:YopX family protein [Rummeliibacillus sp. POC4]|uniref:YopX family protein n=1 Tax=Rummeliibacillus sp. POC4 TaxID=2305899 RepID=UPI000E662E9F|nr:YopX family protein [Rummeliibacillus sp. POC4]RIJ64109.1 hypothetical protein D1606_11810 [Rummeliibacillus sp. POC4]